MRRPDVAHNPGNDQYLVVWEESGDIYGHRVDADGDRLGTALSICTADGTQKEAAVAYDDDNDSYLVVWEDERSDSGDIYGRKVAADGTVDRSTIVIEDASGAQEWPALAYDSTGDRFLVVWQNGEPGDVDGCLVDVAQQNPVGACNSYATGDDDDRYPTVAANPGDSTRRFLVVWARCVSQGSDTVQVRFVESDGDPGTSISDILDAGSADNSAVRPSVAYEATTACNASYHCFLVAAAKRDVGYYYLYGRLVDEQGGKPGNSFQVSAGYFIWERPAGIAALDGKFWAVWWPDPGAFGHARSVNPADGSRGTVFTLFGPEPSRGSGPPAMACDGSTRCLVVHGVSVGGTDQVYAGWFFR